MSSVKSVFETFEDHLDSVLTSVEQAPYLFDSPTLATLQFALYLEWDRLKTSGLCGLENTGLERISRKLYRLGTKETIQFKGENTHVKKYLIQRTGPSVPELV